MKNDIIFIDNKTYLSIDDIRNYFDEFLKENLPHIHLVKPEGLYLCWVDFRECGLDKDELEKTMLEKAGLWLDEGYIFGIGGEGFERLQFQEVF